VSQRQEELKFWTLLSKALLYKVIKKVSSKPNGTDKVISRALKVFLLWVLLEGMFSYFSSIWLLLMYTFVHVVLTIVIKSLFYIQPILITERKSYQLCWGFGHLGVLMFRSLKIEVKEESDSVSSKIWGSARRPRFSMRGSSRRPTMAPMAVGLTTPKRMNSIFVTRNLCVFGPDLNPFAPYIVINLSLH